MNSPDAEEIAEARESGPMLVASVFVGAIATLSVIGLMSSYFAKKGRGR